LIHKILEHAIPWRDNNSSFIARLDAYSIRMDHDRSIENEIMLSY